MKNNRGWGLAMMIVLMSILLSFLVLVTILIYNLYNIKTNTVDNVNTKEDYLIHEDAKINSDKKYKTYENRIKSNAITYVYNYFQDGIKDGVKVTLSDMQNNNIMGDIFDVKDKTLCDGYAIVYLQDNKIISTPYLKCSNYITEGYEE